MRLSFALVTSMVAAAALGAAPRPQDAPGIGGVWTLNRTTSELPRDIGFNPSWLPAAAAEGAGSGSTGRGRGGRGSSGGSRESAAPFSSRAASYDDARRLQLLNTEARNPPARLTIVDTPATVTLTNELGQSRTLHPDGRLESIDVEGVPIAVTSKRDGGRLLVVYRAENDRDVRYTYEAAGAPARLTVDVQFIERGTGDKARRIYEPGLAQTTAAGTRAPASPTASQPPPETYDQRPGAELKGLTNLGILVEELSGPAVSCGLNREALETALSKKLTAGGFTVRRNSDEDTYVYVNIMTSRLGDGTCASRYDAFLYTQGTARLSYHEQPVLVQVSLIHRGGIGTSAAAAHGLAVGRGLEGYLDLFITQIRDANK